MKIVIVGGGTAGWLTALYLAKANVYNQQKNEIVVIESSKIGIIGAGEGTTGVFADVVNIKFKDCFKINELDFLYNTEATLKLGLLFKDWNGIGTEYLSPILPTDSNMANVDIDLLTSLIKGNYYDSSTTGYLMANGYSTFLANKNSSLNLHAYHFDAHKVGEYLKSKCIANGVNTIDTEINYLNKNSITGELESVETNIGKINADFWIDCSGMSKVLIDSMNGGFVDYEEYLPTNTAMPYIHQFEKDEAVKLETLAWAQNDGWMWQIPTQTRYGCGYVYCDYFTNENKVLDDLQKTTGRKIEPIRTLKFKAGRVKNPWIKNVVAIGLSSGFLEPLQATSIHTTILQIEMLLYYSNNMSMAKENIVTNNNQTIYNRYVGNIFDDNRDLLQLHYMTNREDTEFWKYCKYALKRTDKTNEILEMCKYKSPSALDFSMYHGSGSWGVFGWTLAGLGHITKEVATNTMKSNGVFQNGEERYKRITHRNKLNSIRLLTNKEFMKVLKNKELTNT